MLAPLGKDDDILESLEDERSERHFGENPCSSLYECKIKGMVSLKVRAMHLFLFVLGSVDGEIDLKRNPRWFMGNSSSYMKP